MIATSAETNSSCFRAEADGGAAPWREVVYEYLKFCLEVENRLGNTKYLMNMLIPGKNKEFKEAKQCKTYLDICRNLGFDDLVPAAMRVDEILDLSQKWESVPASVPASAHVAADGPEGKSKAVQAAMESEAARAAGGGAARSKATPAVPNGCGPIRRTSMPEQKVRVDAEQPAADVTVPPVEAQTQAQSQPQVAV
jgi:tRNA-dihydrouridine synthase 2